MVMARRASGGGRAEGGGRRRGKATGEGSARALGKFSKSVVGLYGGGAGTNFLNSSGRTIHSSVNR
jgi:hypothetical protein